jgi:hypothetical protein
LRLGGLAEITGGGARRFKEAAVGGGGFGLLVEVLGERVGEGVEFLRRGFALVGRGAVKGLSKLVESAGGGFEIGAGERLANRAWLGGIGAVLAGEPRSAGEGAASVVDVALGDTGLVLQLGGFLGKGLGGLGAGVVGRDRAVGELGLDLADGGGGGLLFGGGRWRSGHAGLGRGRGLGEAGELASGFFVGGRGALGLETGGVGTLRYELVGQNQSDERARDGGPGPAETGLDDAGGIDAARERFGAADGGGHKVTLFDPVGGGELDGGGERVLGGKGAVGLASRASGRPDTAGSGKRGGNRGERESERERGEGEDPPIERQQRGERDDAELGEDDAGEGDEQEREEPQAKVMNEDGGALAGGDAAGGGSGEKWKRRAVTRLDRVEGVVFCSHARWYESSGSRDRMRVGVRIGCSG